MDSERTIEGITWKDDLAWMEPMKGEAWNSHIKKENKRWDSAVKGLDIQPIIDELNSSFKQARLFKFKSSGILISIIGTNAIEWKYADSSVVHSAVDIITDSKDNVWAIEETGAGKELYALRFYKKGHILAWQRSGVSPSVAVVGSRCYFLESKNHLIYWRLVSCDAYTGKSSKIEYEEQDYRYNLELIRGDDRHAYVRRQSGSKQDILLITRNVSVLDGASLDSRRFVFGSHTAEYLAWSHATGWLESKALSEYSWRFPSWKEEVPETLDTRRRLLVTKWYGCRTLWQIRRNEAPKILWKGWGSVQIDPWSSAWIRINVPGQDTQWYTSDTIVQVEESGDCSMATSKDGTAIPYYLLKPATKVKGLLVVGYGAYGIPTSFMTQRWQPLLTRGWAIVIGLWRGGGDHTPEWEDAGRLDGRQRVLEDAEAVVRDARKLLGISAKKTVLYGRSAGGLWVGGLIARHPTGNLAGGAYMEVPYLDVLRTITNRSLPLTNIETDEFGLPEQRFSDFLSAFEWSPMERIPAGGIPGVWQIVRTGINDKEVLAYESAKWIYRSKNPRAFLAIESGQGHFVSGDIGIHQEAEDLALLLELTK